MKLPDEVDTVALLEAAKEEDVSFVAGPDFLIEGGRSNLRFSFASVPAEQIGDGVGRIARALETLGSPAPA